jgi:hypothetical protein
MYTTHRIYLTGTNEDVLQKMQAHGFNVTTCGDCGAIVLHESPAWHDLKCYECGFESDPADFPDLVVVDN